MISMVKASMRPSRSSFDDLLLWTFIGLLSFGLVMVYSASIAIAEGSRYTNYQAGYYLFRQAIFIVIGLGCAFVTFQVSLERWQQWSRPLFILGIFLLTLVLIPGVGKEVNGSQRWISFYVFNLQPSELMKFFVVLYAADYTVRKANMTHLLGKTFIPMLIVMVLVGFLLLSEPDMGAFVVVCAIAMGTIWLGGFSLKVFAGLSLALPLAFAALILSSEYRRQRVTGFLDPWADAFGSGYQLSHALIAFGRGEWFGVGLGASVEKLFYLPEAHTDFLVAVIGEELGLLGVIAVVVMFAVIVVRAFQIGRQAVLQERNFEALVAQGIGIWLGVQAIINIAVNVGMMPTKGLTLPFMSFGGSGVVVNCIVAAVLLRIDYDNRRAARGLSI